MTRRRARRGSASRTLAFLLALAGCGCGPAAPEPQAIQADEAALSAVLSSTWHAAVLRDPSALEALLDGPGGDGWLSLFHGDLAGAEATFASALASLPNAPAPHLGLARVALARADVLRAARTLEQRTAPDLVAYRAAREQRVRQGAHEALLAALTLQGLVGSGTAYEEALLAARTETPAQPEFAAPLRALLDARTAGSAQAPSGLPEPLATRLAAAAAVDRFESVAIDAGSPDFVDALGRDEQADLQFSLSWWDPALAEARLRAQLLRVIEHGAAAGDAGAPLVAVALAAWSTDSPPPRPPPAAESAPRALALFGSPWADIDDLQAAWQQGGRTLLSRVAATAPDQRLQQGVTAADVDRVLRFEAAFVTAATRTLTSLATEQGAPLVRDLELPRLLADRVLRQRMDEMLAEGHPIHALRLAERSLGVTGGKGEGSAGTRISHRNDAGFLVRLGTLHAASRRPGVAREYVHPLTSPFPELAGVSYTLGQLDAASSIGVQGKTSQQ